MLRDYLNQIVILKSLIGMDEYNEPIFGEAKEVECRLIDRFKRIVNDKGEEVVSDGIIQCYESIKVGDYIDNRKVIAVNSIVDLEGIIGYKGYLL